MSQVSDELATNIVHDVTASLSISDDEWIHMASHSNFPRGAHLKYYPSVRAFGYGTIAFFVKNRDDEGVRGHLDRERDIAHAHIQVPQKSLRFFCG